MPIGNGRMDTLVWTTRECAEIPDSPVWPFRRIDLEIAGSGAGVFTRDGTHQRLSVYEGLLDVKAAGVNARMVAWHEQDVIAIEVEDRRSAPEPIQINTPRSGTVHARDGRIVILEDFRKERLG